MSKIRDLATLGNVKDDCLEAKCFFKNGTIMEITHVYGESFNRRGYDFKTKGWQTHNEMELYLKKYGIKEEDFIGCLVETMKKAYGNKGVRPFQEFKCKINDDTFTAFFALIKRKDRIFNGSNDILLVGILEALNDEARNEMKNLKEVAMTLEI